MVKQKYRKRTISEMYGNAFYQFHKFLMPIKISEGAKIMYCVMDERYRQSLDNGWRDSEGSCYFQMSNEELRKTMCCSNQTVVNRREELIAEGLLLEEKVPGRATRKYLTVPTDYIEQNEEEYVEYDSRLKSRRQPSNNQTTAVYNVDTSNKDLKRNINNNKKTSPTKVADSPKNLFLDFVYLSNEQYEKLCSDFTEERADNEIEALNNYLANTKKVYKSHYHTLRNWLNKKNGSKAAPPTPEPFTLANVKTTTVQQEEQPNDDELDAQIEQLQRELAEINAAKEREERSKWE